MMRRDKARFWSDSKYEEVAPRSPLVLFRVMMRLLPISKGKPSANKHNTFFVMGMGRIKFVFSSIPFDLMTFKWGLFLCQMLVFNWHFTSLHYLNLPIINVRHLNFIRVNYCFSNCNNRTYCFVLYSFCIFSVCDGFHNDNFHFIV